MTRHVQVCLSVYISKLDLCKENGLNSIEIFRMTWNRFHETLGCFYCVHVSVSCVKADINLNISASGCKSQAHGRLCGVSGQ